MRVNIDKNKVVYSLEYTKEGLQITGKWKGLLTQINSDYLQDVSDFEALKEAVVFNLASQTETIFKGE